MCVCAGVYVYKYYIKKKTQGIGYVKKIKKELDRYTICQIILHLLIIIICLPLL